MVESGTSDVAERRDARAAASGAEGPDPDVERAARGDREAFARLYRRHAARVHGLARRALGAARADDLTQEVFLAAWRGLARFEGRAGFGTWLHALARNAVASALRRDGRAHAGADDGDEPARRPPDPGERLDLEAAIARLPTGARAVFVLHDVEGRTHAEIAELLGVDAGTSKSQLHRARMLLRGMLQDDGGSR